MWHFCVKIPIWLLFFENCLFRPIKTFVQDKIMLRHLFYSYIHPFNGLNLMNLSKLSKKALERMLRIHFQIVLTTNVNYILKH